MSGFDFWGTCKPEMNSDKTSSSSDEVGFEPVPTLISLRSGSSGHFQAQEFDGYISSEPCSGDLYSQSEYPELRTSTPQFGFSDASNYHPPRYERDYNPRKQQYNDGSQLIIRHLHPMITEELLCGELSSFGNIMQMKLKPDKKFPNVNFTYITFEYTESAEKAVQHINSEAFLPNWTFFPNRPKAQMYNPVSRRENDSSSQISVNSSASQTKQRVLILESEQKLPQFTAMEIPDTFTTSTFGLDLHPNHISPKNDIFCYYANASEEKVDWKIGKVISTDGKSAGFSRISILYPDYEAEKVVFNGCLYQCDYTVRSCALSGVKLTEDANIKPAVEALTNFTNKTKIAYIDFSSGNNLTSDVSQVKIYKTEKALETDFGNILKLLNYCTIDTAAAAPSQEIQNPIIPAERQPMHLKCTYTIMRPILNTKCTVRVCNIEQWPIFHVQIICKPLFRTTEMNNILQSMRTKMKAKRDLKPGSLVVTDWNNCLYRGIIIENDKNSDYLVYYLDWGNRNYTKYASVDRPAAFWELPAMAIPVVIDGWQSIPVEKQPLIKNTLLDYLKSAITMQDVEFVSGPSDRIVLREIIKENDMTDTAYGIRIPVLDEIIKQL